MTVHPLENQNISMRIWHKLYFLSVLLPLLIIALVPALRIPALKLIRGTNHAYYGLPFVPFNGHVAPQPSDVLAAAPDSLDAQILALDHGIFFGQLEKFNRPESQFFQTNKMRAFAELSEQHPDNVLLIALALINAPTRDGRVAGPWEADPVWDKSLLFPGITVAPGPNMGLPTPSGASSFPYSTIPSSDLNPGDIELGLRLARRGQKMEPDNTFFDWMAMHFYFAAHRDNEAIRTLLGASAKKGFDAHERELARTSYRASALVTPLPAEEKALALLNLRGPQVNLFTHLNRMALWMAMQKEDAGDSKGTLDIEAAIMHLETTAFKHTLFNYRKQLVFGNVMWLWGGPEYRNQARKLNATQSKLWKPVRSAAGIRARAQRFATYARSQGREKLARQTLALTPELVAFRTAAGDDLSETSFIYRGRGGPMDQLCFSWWAAALACWQLLLATGLIILCSVAIPLCSMGGGSAPRLSSRTIVSSIVLGHAISLIGFAYGCSFLSEFWFSDEGGGYSYPYEYLTPQILGFTAIVAPLVIGAFVSLLTPLLSTQSLPPFDRNEVAPHPGYRLLRKLLIPLSQLQILIWFRLLPLAVLFFAQYYLLAILPLELQLKVTSLWHELYGPLQSEKWVPLCGLVTTSVLYAFALFVRWRLSLVPSARLAIIAGLLAFRRTMAWTIPLALWILIGALAFGHSARAELEAQTNHFLDSGNKR